ncbi:PAS domain-containing protein [Sporotomaculum syntrophicum]|uniref:PAS domain-containing protein n=1 Tax=Sporotomaculum syntrophicum TaxID=182264 RepID=UPI00137AD916|nr:PAS domain S-box protein [Sporotomaculum syntrophicum]
MNRQQNLPNMQLLDIIDFLPDPTLVVDQDRKVVAWNRAIERITGVSKADIIDKGEYAYSLPFYGKARPVLLDLIFTDDYTTEKKYRNVVKEENTIYGEVLVKLPYNQKEVLLWLKASPLYDSKGNIVGAIETARDITECKRNHPQELVNKQIIELETANEQLQKEIFEQKQVEESLREIKELYCQLVENSPNAILLHSKNKLKFINKAGVKLFGLGSIREAVGVSMIDLIHPDYKDIVAEKWRQVQDERVTASLMEEKIVRPDGKVLDIEVVTAPCTIQGKNIMQALVFDITDRKRAEKMLRLSEEKFSTAFNAGPNPMAITTIESGRIIDVNSNFLSFFGYSRQQVINKTIADLNIYKNPEDRTKLINYIVQHGFIKNLNINFRKRSGDIRIALFSSEIIAIGGEQYLLSVISDITELKQVEQALRLSEERFCKAFYNNPTPMVITRQSDDKHIEVNKSYERFFGFCREELIGRTASDICIFNDTEQFKLYNKQLSILHNFCSIKFNAII